MTREETIHELGEWLEQMIQHGVPSHSAKRKALATAIALLSAEVVPQSEQYKKGFEDAKRAFLVEYARESKNMRKRNAQLEVMLNAYRAISADAVCKAHEEEHLNIINRIKELQYAVAKPNCQKCAIKELWQATEKEDLVAVVRCKDCRHRDLFSCPLADNDFQKDDDYCSWGELADKTKYPATYNTNTKCGGCVHLDELGRCLNFMLAKDDRSCWRGSWENNNGELAEQTERREK